MPGPKLPRYAGEAVEVLKGLADWLSVRHEGRIVLPQETPPSPVFLRTGHGRSAPVPVPPSGAHGLGELWTAALEKLDSRVENERDPGTITGSATRRRQVRSRLPAQADVP